MDSQQNYILECDEVDIDLLLVSGLFLWCIQTRSMDGVVGPNNDLYSHQNLRYLILDFWDFPVDFCRCMVYNKLHRMIL